MLTSLTSQRGEKIGQDPRRARVSGDHPDLTEATEWALRAGVPSYAIRYAADLESFASSAAKDELCVLQRRDGGGGERERQSRRTVDRIATSSSPSSRGKQSGLMEAKDGTLNTVQSCRRDKRDNSLILVLPCCRDNRLLSLVYVDFRRYIM